ncbi:biotin [Elsinoe australis]|uniref:Biotin n=1 Tax=Elsinoe australis TaxID=40998 RepID=A0A2P8AG89_9PEZI|nr:biotin [Elsinoe australis]
MLTISGLDHGTYTFYPLGNTPAVDLLRDTPTSDSQPARLLLLGCGDARNVLFTVAQEIARTKNLQEYTVCDFEPAVLARNIYLFTFLAQHSESIKGGEGARIVSSLWNLYYHFFISEDDLKVLQNHAKVLVSHSNSLTSWQDSPFGSSIEITNAATLSALHRFWSLYADGKDFSKHGDFRTQFKSQIAGIHAAEVMDAIEYCHDHYWTHGEAVPTDSVTAGPQKLAVNPALSSSSAKANVFAISRSTNYLAGFHFPTSSEIATRQPTSKTVRAITLAAQLEFAGWCADFASAINAKRVHLIAHCGEALRFAYEIQFLQSKPSALPKTFRIYDRQHSGQVLDICAFSRSRLSNPFNVIETSNLSDHVGLLALLPATSSLLHPSPTSVLYTETLRAKDDVDDSSLQEMLGVDAVTAARILGLIPAGLVNGFMIDVSIPDIGSHEDSYNMRCRFTWRLTMSSQLGAAEGTISVAAFDPDQLSALLFRWYKLMEPADLF